MKLFSWLRKKTPKINFEEEKLVVCYFSVITDYKEWYEGDRTYWRASEIPLSGIRILVKEERRYSYDKYYEPEELLKDYKPAEGLEFYGKKFYYDSIKELNGVGDLKVNPLHNELPIQYLTQIELTAEELTTKEITLERIKELENLLNSK